MEKSKEAATPISTSCYLDVDDKGVDVDQTKYRGLIDSLLMEYAPATLINE